MIIRPNNDAARAVHRVGSSTIYKGRTGTSEEEENLEQAEDTLSEEQLNLTKAAIEEARSEMESAGGYLARNRAALNWWGARWPNQWDNGRKWSDNASERETIMPWPNASDTRDRTVEMVVNEHVTVAMFALQNMKVQARSTHPLMTMRESQQAATLLNWQLFTHMKMEMHREMNLAMNWRFGYGASIVAVDWEQERRLYTETITVMTLQAVLAEAGGGGVGQQAGGLLDGSQAGRPELRTGGDDAAWTGGEAGGGIGLGADAPRIDEVADLLMDSAYEEEMIALLQSLSPIMSKPDARKALNDLRQLRYAEIKVVDIFASKPRVMAMRPGVDVIFQKDLDDPQNARWIARVERVSETELLDRIETAGYDADFVDEALEFKGDVTNEAWGRQTAVERGTARYITPNNRGGGLHTRMAGRGAAGFDSDKMVELYHVQSLQHDRGAPVLMDTVLHMNVDRVAKHGPCGYEHGKICYHGLRMEYKERPFLSSEGIPEKAYTWEQELKSQFDAQVDRSDLALQPPFLTDNYEEVAKWKTQLAPATVVPVKRHGSQQWMQPPQYDIGSVQIVKTVMEKVDRFFGLFGASVDPDLKQIRRVTIGAALMTELHPIIMQIFQLDQQLLPDEVAAAVSAPNAPMIHVDRQQIQGQYQISATIEMRMLDKEFRQEYVEFATQLSGLDSLGVTDRAAFIRTGAELYSQDFAEMAIKDTQPATEAEAADERKAVRAILSSGIDQEVAKAGNFSLRLQTLQQYAQELLSTNPVVQRFVKQNPEAIEVLQKRAEGYQNQLQQQENAQIGRMLTTQTFTKKAPVQQEEGMLGGY